MGFWSPAVLLNDARRHGIAVLPADVNESAANYMPENRRVRIGLATVQGLGQSGAGRIVAARVGHPFASLLDFCRRTRLPRRLVENLITAGALDGMRGAGEGRRALLWQLGLLDYEQETLLSGQEPEAAPEELPPLAALEAMAGELRVMGVSAGPHVMAHHRAAMQQTGVLSSRELTHHGAGALVWVAGQVTVIQVATHRQGLHVRHPGRRVRHGQRHRRAGRGRLLPPRLAAHPLAGRARLDSAPRAGGQSAGCATLAAARQPVSREYLTRQGIDARIAPCAPIV
ncbi:MAG: hypothetical protein V9H69_17285 [Anaerolineae bacterium]